MKFSKLLVCGVIALFSLVVVAQTIIEGDDSGDQNKVIHRSGCGYTKPLRVAGMIGNPPFGWVERHDERISKDLESYGLGREILDKIAQQMGISYISMGFLSYTKAINALKRGDIDLLLGMYYNRTDLGLGTIVVEPSYFTNIFTVYFKKGKELSISSFNDLSGLRGIVRREEQIYPLIYRKLPIGVELTQVSTAKKAYEMLMNDEADYLLGSPYSQEAELRRFKLNNEIVPGSQVLDNSNLFFVFSSNSDCRKLREKFSEILESDTLSASEIDTTIRRVIDNWGERFRDEKGLLDEDDEEESPSNSNDS